MNAKKISIILILAVASSACALAKDKGGKGNGNGKSAGPAKSSAHVHTPGRNHNHHQSPSVNISVTFGSSERDTIRAYVATGKKGKGLPPGLAKKVANGGDLPPGWQKKCVHGEILPEIVFKHCHPLPADLVVKLPAPPHGTVFVAIDGKVLHVNKSTRHIHAVIDLD